MRIRATISGLAVAVLLSMAASAQSRTDQADPKGCAPHERLQHQEGANAPKVPETTGQNLSDKLARTDGVLCPPNIDPDIKAPTPETGKMPVIPPPGSPGGDQSVQPK